MNRDSRFSWTHPLEALLRQRDARFCPNWQLPRVELEVTRGRTRQSVRSLETRAFLIGAASDCDLVLTDPQFPAVYAYVMRDADGARIRAIAESPLLCVNGERVEETRLDDGDVIRTGPYEFRVRLTPPAIQVVVSRTGREHRIDPAAMPNGGMRISATAAAKKR
jgi:predicted component of type VI protein secretion system